MPPHERLQLLRIKQVSKDFLSIIQFPQQILQKIFRHQYISFSRLSSLAMQRHMRHLYIRLSWFTESAVGDCVTPWKVRCIVCWGLVLKSLVLSPQTRSLGYFIWLPGVTCHLCADSSCQSYPRLRCDPVLCKHSSLLECPTGTPNFTRPKPNS